VFDFLIGLAFVAMVIGPAILASIQRSKSHDGASDAGNAAATGSNDARGGKLDI
jgi:hypothetical protein